ncbi:MAG TPA: rhodanese-like domain-containing protein [Anaerolineales bacterium]|nr:rhodanese-like domain-containing protein [Anaerolineales bacterium]
MKQKKTQKTHHKMKQTFNPLLLLASLSILVVLGGIVFLNQRNDVKGDALPPEVSVFEAAALREAGAFILDVRQPEEWNESHIPGSTLIPLGELASRVDELPRDRQIVVVCRSGNRSAQGRDILLAAGFSQVTSMAGGINQWKAAGYETLSGP